MSNATLQMVQDLEWLAAWQRINATHADALWSWEARLLAAEQLERDATALRAGRSPARSGRIGRIADAQQNKAA